MTPAEARDHLQRGQSLQGLDQDEALRLANEVSKEGVPATARPKGDGWEVVKVGAGWGA